MGIFDTIGSAVSSVASKAYKGVKSTGEKAVKGVKRGAGKVAKGAKSAGFNKNFMRSFQKGLAKAGRILQAPQKFIRKNDPIAKKMGSFGDFSPISLASSIALAPITTTGMLEELAGSKKKQKKLRSGDADTITDLALAPLSYLPAGGASKGAKLGSKLASRGIRALGRFF